MSAINLIQRITDDKKKYHDALNSDDSLIYIKPIVPIEESEPGSLDMFVGDNIYDTDRQQAFTIPAAGIEIKPGRCFVVQTRELLMLPHNLVGILSGKGSLIFRGLFVSQGKIDPGFKGPLRVGLLNAGRASYLLKSGDPLCSCLFFRLDSHIEMPRAQQPEAPAPVASIGFLTKLKLQGFEWWTKVLGLVVAFIAAVAAVLRYFK